VITEVRFIEAVPGNGRIRCFHFVPDASPVGQLVFLPGWSSVRATWDPTLLALSSDWEIVYVETREKPSSTLERVPDALALSRFVDDLVGVVDAFDLSDGGYVLAGSSLGGTVALEALPRLTRTPQRLILLAPNARFYMPRVAGPLLRYTASWAEPAAALLVRLYMTRVRLRGSDPDHARRFVDGFRSGDVWKNRALAHQLLSYRMDMQRVSTIDTPTIVVGSATDTLHDTQGARAIAAHLAHATYVATDPLRETHGKVLLDLLRSGAAHVPAVSAAI
jgi:pimeloyl-ACP methyl ester carboxylesterase